MIDLSIFPLREKTAFIAGVATGIGRACATTLAKTDANVAISMSMALQVTVPSRHLRLKAQAHCFRSTMSATKVKLIPL